MNILGIESSCDETAASVLSDKGVLSNVIASQAIHEQFGGVVPELASRAHHKTIHQTIEQALNEAQISIDEIDAVAVTQGPGLMGSLLVGLCFAKGFCLSHKIPLIGINHMEAHVYANFIDASPAFPFISLTVSGGHTQIELIKAPFEHQILGKTKDDAAGEAFDKTGKMLGLPYPAGPKMDELSREGNPKFHAFPKALLNDGLDFSFSGLKTSVLYYLQDKNDEFIANHLNDISASITEAITEVLIVKLRRALKKKGLKHFVLAGGVSANSVLRDKVARMAEEEGYSYHIPKLSYCTDNGAMIAAAGRLKYELGQFDDLSLKPFASL